MTSPPQQQQQQEFDVSYFEYAVYQPKDLRPGWYYMVKWVGYDKPTLEPESGVRDLDRLFKSFWKEVGHEMKKQKVRGFRVTPSKKWIRREERMGHQIAGSDYEADSSESSVDIPIKEQTSKPKKKSSKGKSKAQQTSPVTGNTAARSRSSSSGVGASESVAPKPAIRRARKPISDSSDDDTPLTALSKRKASEVEKGEILSMEPPHKMPRLNSPQGTFKAPSKPALSLRTATESLGQASLDLDSLQPPENAPPSPQDSLFDEPMNERSLLAAESSAGPSTRPASRTGPSGIPFIDKSYRNQRKVKLMDGFTSVIGNPTKQKAARAFQEQVAAQHSVNSPLSAQPRSASGQQVPETVSQDEPSVTPGSNDPEHRIENVNDASGPQSADMPTEMDSIDFETARKDVDDFLATIVNEPLLPRPEPLPPLAPSKSLRDLQITKHTLWTGELGLPRVSALSDLERFSLGSSPSSHRLCRTKIVDVSPPKPGQDRLDILIKGAAELLVTHTLPIRNLNLLLAAYKPVAQSGKLVEASQGDLTSFAAYVDYLESTRMMSLARLEFEGTYASDLFIVPTGFLKAVQFVPEMSTTENGSSRITLVLCSMKQKKLLSQRTTTSQSRQQLQYLPLQLDPDQREFIKVLGLNEQLRSIFKGKTFYIYKGEKPSFMVHSECSTLEDILVRAQCEKVSASKSVGIFLIHNRAWADLQCIPSFANRKAKERYTRYYSFGSSASSVPSACRIEEVFRPGLVATFTLNAILEDPFGVQSLIERLHQHFNSAVYILPTILGAALNQLGVASDVQRRAQALKALTGILGAVERGLVSVLTCLPRVNQASGDWLAQQKRLLCTNGVEEHASLFFAAFQKDPLSNLTNEDRLYQTARQDVIESLAEMEMHPYLRRQYRRFIVVGSRDDPAVKRAAKAEQYERELEWTSVSGFNFRDGVQVVEKPSRPRAA